MEQLKKAFEERQTMYTEAYGSFISEADQSCVLTQMDSQADRVYFAPYTPDPFVFQSSSMGMYEKLLSIQKEESSVDPTVPAKKGGFFGWRKNKK